MQGHGTCNEMTPRTTHQIKHDERTSQQQNFQDAQKPWHERDWMLVRVLNARQAHPRSSRTSPSSPVAPLQIDLLPLHHHPQTHSTTPWDGRGVYVPRVPHSAGVWQGGVWLQHWTGAHYWCHNLPSVVPPCLVPFAALAAARDLVAPLSGSAWCPECQRQILQVLTWDVWHECYYLWQTPWRRESGP
jgi:hypothetical protein